MLKDTENFIKKKIINTKKVIKTQNNNKNWWVKKEKFNKDI